MSAVRIWRPLGVATFMLACVAAFAIGSALPLGFDFAAYWSAARHLESGEPLYSSPGALTVRGGEFRYLPLTALLFRPFAALPFPVAGAVWLAFLVAVAAAVGAYLIRPLPRSAWPWAGAGYVLFLPLVLDVAIGNLNLVTLALCLLAWRWRARAPVSGALLAAAVGLKLLPLTLPLFYLAAGRVRTFAWAAACGSGALLLMALTLPGELGDFIGQALAVGGTYQPLTYAVAAVSIAIAIASGRAARAGRSDADELHRLALASAPYVLPVAIFWTPFLVLSLPLFASALGRVLASPPLTRALLVAAVAAFWLLMDVARLGDAVQVAAHAAGLAGLAALAALQVVRDQRRVALRGGDRAFVRQREVAPQIRR